MAYSKSEKLSLLSELIELAKSDFVIKDSELNFIRAIAKNFEITDIELNRLFEKAAPKVVMKSENDRILQFQRLILLMNVDQQSSLSEISAIKNFGLFMGLPLQAIDEVLEIMNNYENKIIPPYEFLKIFKKFYN